MVRSKRSQPLYVSDSEEEGDIQEQRSIWQQMQTKPITFWHDHQQIKIELETNIIINRFADLPSPFLNDYRSKLAYMQQICLNFE